MRVLQLSLFALGAVALLASPALASQCRQDALKVGLLCVDKYEASVWQIASDKAALIKNVQKGKIKSATDLADAIQRGDLSDDYGAGCPDTGNGCKDFYAVSVPGVKPAAFLTWFQAGAACRNAGKRLLTNAEWTAVALGTPDPGTDNGTTNCNISAAAAVVNTGSRSLCTSNTGAFDTVGNVWEWVADWADRVTTSTPGTWSQPGYGSDESFFGGTGSTPLPGALRRGGSFSDGTKAGVFHVSGQSFPSDSHASIGFRCAREPRVVPPPKQVQVDRKCRHDAVRVGPLCVDKYEASIWEIPAANTALIKNVQKGKIKTATDLAGATQRGVVGSDYGAGCPETGNGCKSYYAVSVPGVTPSSAATWFQAAAACRNSLKRLLTNAEWQIAALGTPDSGTDNGTTDCNTATVVVVETGSRSLCVSDSGAFDMVGNLDEWVADWGDQGTGCTSWSATYGADSSCVGGTGTLLPGGFSRGGDFASGAGAGVFAVGSNSSASYADPSIGFRCARKPSFQ